MPNESGRSSRPTIYRNASDEQLADHLARTGTFGAAAGRLIPESIKRGRSDPVSFVGRPNDGGGEGGDGWSEGDLEQASTYDFSRAILFATPPPVAMST